MALETLKGVATIDGFNLVVMDELREQFPEKFNESGAMDWHWFESEIRPNNFVYLRRDKNSLSFTLQNGPVKEVGVNGCQVDTLVAAALLIVEGLNHNFPSTHNEKAIAGLQQALDAFKERKVERDARGVEGMYYGPQCFFYIDVREPGFHDRFWGKFVAAFEQAVRRSLSPFRGELAEPM